MVSGAPWAGGGSSVHLGALWHSRSEAGYSADPIRDKTALSGLHASSHFLTKEKGRSRASEQSGQAASVRVGHMPSAVGGWLLLRLQGWAPGPGQAWTAASCRLLPRLYTVPASYSQLHTVKILPAPVLQWLCVFKDLGSAAASLVCGDHCILVPLL